ncbi:hypothetical protein [Kitasatospora viridis]|uniref:Uncharacterized protein n=1 Tax=Kitasatospora viridis TaxID=281105 RepID=A0A561UGF0_9ACTN|nr:hypothetical protein [Kitasatospora viridis]TWF98430.1 hypothetical protein FHX73_112238 [Kitasatospora viridis]
MSALSVHHRALVTWLAVYPTITVASILLAPYTAHLPVYLRTLLLTALVVPVVAYGLVPLFSRALLAGRARRTDRYARYTRDAVM